MSQQALLFEGVPLAFLPLIHHSLLVYSTPVADFVRENKFDLYAKSDYRFIESVFKLLVDAFSYKPAISVPQFFSEGFAEHKVILCKDIAVLTLPGKRGLQPDSNVVRTLWCFKTAFLKVREASPDF